MPIIDLVTTKDLLQITSSDYDSTIVSLIPRIRDFVVDYTHNQFIADQFVLTSNIAFVSGTPSTITDSEETFLDNYLLNAKDILVEGSYYNDGYYKVHSSTAITAGTITLDNAESLNDEDEGASVAIWKVDFPKGIQETVARMINYKLQTTIDKGIKSEHIGDYSVTYDTGGAYPQSILSGLRTYRKLYA